LTFVTGITRYALTAMDSGPNHLLDISLDPWFAGICGITKEEVYPLFEDRLDDALANVKLSGKLSPTAGRDELMEAIYEWYDGYNWGGDTRVLNPYSIFHFFAKNLFDNYWIQSGRPGHLTALIKKRPLDFLEPELDSYLSQDLRKTELNRLGVVPVLFHSGYLTLEKAVSEPRVDKLTGETKIEYRYYFTLPNREVSDSYRRDCFSAFFDIEKEKDTQVCSRVHLSGWAHDFAIFRFYERFFDLKVGASPLDQKFPRLDNFNIMLMVIQRQDDLEFMTKLNPDIPLTVGTTMQVSTSDP
jgi:hypothetical protein